MGVSARKALDYSVFELADSNCWSRSEMKGFGRAENRSLLGLKAHRERRTHAGRAGDADGPAMQIHRIFDNRETQTGAWNVSHIAGPVERLKKKGGEFRPRVCEGTRTALRTLASFDPTIKADKIDLPMTYTNSFSRKAKERFKA